MATKAETARRDERVRVRAYMIWEAEGRPDGKHLEHWDQAEREIAAELSAEGNFSGAREGSEPTLQRRS
jgi:hypothetical protein